MQRVGDWSGYRVWRREESKVTERDEREGESLMQLVSFNFISLQRSY